MTAVQNETCALQASKVQKTSQATKTFIVSLLLCVKGVQLGFLTISPEGGVAMTVPPAELMIK
jgi:hypothetical protein